MTHLSRRLDKLERAAVGEDIVDERLAWYHWPDGDAHVVLSMHDFVMQLGEFFVACGGPAETPGFPTLPEMARELVCALWKLYGASRRFASLFASLVDYDAASVVPLHLVESRLQRVQMRRRFPHLLQQFADRGSPWRLYTDAGDARHNPNWPESAAWTDAERDYIQHRYLTWRYAVHGHPCGLFGENRNPFARKAA